MNIHLTGIVKLFSYYKSVGDKTFKQLPDEKLFWQINQSSNSIAIIVNHLHGNMRSRWTDFMSSDGEKSWRKRDEEFEDQITTKKALLEKWEEGWTCLFNALESLTDDQLKEEVFIRNMGHTVLEAIHRQLAHYAYHVGQIVYIGKAVMDEHWTSLSIPKGESVAYNKEKFSKEERREHFTDDL